MSEHVGCSSFAHEEVPATQEIRGIPRNESIWVPYCDRCVKAILLNGYNIEVRERVSA